MNKDLWSRIFPILATLKHYDRQQFFQDLIAAIIVTVMLIPQSLAYALVAGVPPEVGLYASILPLIAYALFGSSRSLSVGPVAVISLMTATTLGTLSAQGSADYLTGAITLSLISGAMLLTMGVLRLGFIVNFLSHSVISGFISASGIIIAFSQVKNILGVSAHGDNMPELLVSLSNTLDQTQLSNVLVGSAVLVFLVWARRWLAVCLTRVGVGKKLANISAKAAPIVAVSITIGVAYGLDATAIHLNLIGHIPPGLPALSLSMPSLQVLESLLLPAFLISLIGYVESISVGKTLAAKKSQRVDPNQELKGLGMANLAAGISGGFPVTGGFSRSVVNYDAGAVTQAASIYTAIGIALATLFLTPILSLLPTATLAATIIVAVLSLVDVGIFKKSWRYDKRDFFAVLTTLVVTLWLGVEVGVACGILASIVLYLYRTSVPHIAEVGLVEGSEHFRNVRRFHVATCAEILSLRPDESLFFANIGFLEALISQRVFERDKISHVIIMCSAINDIDFSALEVLQAVNQQLYEQGITLHFSEVKGPVMDKLENTPLLKALSGNIYLSQYDAYKKVCETLAKPQPEIASP